MDSIDGCHSPGTCWFKTRTRKKYQFADLILSQRIVPCPPAETDAVAHRQRGYGYPELNHPAIRLVDRELTGLGHRAQTHKHKCGPPDRNDANWPPTQPRRWRPRAQPWRVRNTPTSTDPQIVDYSTAIQGYLERSPLVPTPMLPYVR